VTPADQTEQTAPEPGPDAGAPAPAGAEQLPAAAGFRSRGRARRRLRFLRKARELAYRDLGGLVFSLHRFGQRNDALVLAKLDVLGKIDGEVRFLEGVLADRRPVTVLREPGITACPRCAAIHSSEDRFCPSCGISMGRNADLPMAVGPGSQPAPATSAAEPAPGAEPGRVMPEPAPQTPAEPQAAPAPPDGPPAAGEGRSPVPPAAARPAPPAGDGGQLTEILPAPSRGT